MPQKREEEFDFSAASKELEEINRWFQDSEDIDMKLALEKYRRGAELVKQARKYLAKIENEFKEINSSLEEEG